MTTKIQTYKDFNKYMNVSPLCRNKISHDLSLEIFNSNRFISFQQWCFETKSETHRSSTGSFLFTELVCTISRIVRRPSIYRPIINRRYSTYLGTVQNQLYTTLRGEFIVLTKISTKTTPETHRIWHESIYKEEVLYRNRIW